MITEAKLPVIVKGRNSLGNPQPIHRISSHGFWLDPDIDIEAVEQDSGCDFSLLIERCRRPAYFRIKHLAQDNELGAQMCQFLALYGFEIVRRTFRSRMIVTVNCSREEWSRTFAPAYHENGTRRRNTWCRVTSFRDYLLRPYQLRAVTSV